MVSSFSLLPAFAVATMALLTSTMQAAAASTGLRLRTTSTSLLAWTSTAAMSVRTTSTFGAGPTLSVSSQNQNNKCDFPKPVRAQESRQIEILESLYPAPAGRWSVLELKQRSLPTAGAAALISPPPHVHPEALTSYASNWNADHVSHFLWSKTASVAYAEAYNDTEASESDIFFTNSTEETANPNFTVNGITGKYRALSKAECKYLIEERVVNDGQGEDHSYSLNITYGGQKGFVLYPDDYTEEIISGTITSLPEGVVFLPAAGGRDGSIIIGTNAYSSYWLASPTEGFIDGAQFMDFNGSQFRTDNGNREIGMAVRLVTDVK